MSILKNRLCDCCGKEIPYDDAKVHMEYDGHVANCLTYIADDDGNRDFNWLSKKGDKIFGLVDINMHRSQDESTVVLSNYSGNGRCMDICKECKIKFLEKTIEHLKKHG